MEEEIKEEVAEETIDADAIAAQQETEDRAQKMGWIPKEKFKGNPDRWRPAEEYVKRADELMPIMKSQLGKYEGEITTLKTTIDRQTKTMEQLVKMSEGVGKREYDRALRDLKAKQIEAVSTGNTEEWQKLEDEKEKLKEPEPIKIEASSPNPAAEPVFIAWQEDNEWYQKDDQMTLFADAYGDNLSKNNKNLKYEEFLKMVEEETRKAFPHKFTNPNRTRASAVDAGVTRSSATDSGKKKTYSDLPAEAKAQCDKWVKDGTFKKSEDYVKSYFEEE